MFPRDGVSLEETKPKVAQTKALADFAVEISERIATEDFATPTPATAFTPPEKVDITRLPETGAELFGRQKELDLLDEMWDSPSANIVTLAARAGVGKSALVNHWLEYMKVDNYRGAQRVYGWSFYSQGTGQRVTSADQFIAQALEWFGDPDPTQGSPWDKGERLAALVRKQKTLLILDGLEPLQSGFDFDKGKITDPALSVLVTQLARQNNGLCVITTRENIAELKQFETAVIQLDLEQISKEAGRALLRAGGVRGTDEELEQASKRRGNHALAVSLFAAGLLAIKGHRTSDAPSVSDLNTQEATVGTGKRRVFISYSHKDEEWKNRLVAHLGVLEQQDLLQTWDDRKINAGADWYNEIRDAMAETPVAVCLISADYLASDFVIKEEVPYLLKRREEEGMTIIPVLLRPCLWETVKWLAAIQMFPRDGKTVSADFQGQEDVVFADAAREMHKALDNPDYRPAKAASAWTPPEELDIGRLPATGFELFGRDKELQLLDEMWDSGSANVVSLVAWGGVGKSTLINQWLRDLERDNYRGAQRVYA